LLPSKWSLGAKFISILMLILLIPIASIGLLKEIEKALVGNLRENLLLSASLIGNQLSQKTEWFEESLLPDSDQFIGEEIFVFPLDSSFNLDGYFDDWINFEQHRQKFSGDSSTSSTSSEMSMLVGYFERHLILSISVIDNKIVYLTDDLLQNSDEIASGVQSEKPLRQNYSSDRLEIEYKDQRGVYRLLYLTPKGAGELAVKVNKNGEKIIDWRYKAFWIETKSGFDLELKFPSDIKPSEIRLVRKNVDGNKQSEFDSKQASSQYGLNPLVWPSKNIVSYIAQTKLNAAQRIWVLDTYGRVLASSGNLKTSTLEFSSNPILNWVLANQSELLVDPRANHLRLDSEGIFLALKGEASARVENIKNSDQSIALATFPIQSSRERQNNKVLGVLLLEENVARIQVTQKKTLINMFFIILTVLVLVIWVIFWYVSRLVRRIKKLNKAIGAVVDPQGRMQEPLTLPIVEGDEIDDLNRSFSQMGERLYEYNDHLEKLASRLSHELRTPIAIVRSSLDNLLLSCQTEEEKNTIERAIQGNSRLGEIISRMRQASSVKEAMQSAETKAVDLQSVLQQMICGYKQSFQSHKFELNCQLTEDAHQLSVDLFSEMMDKLVANAMEFSDRSQPIKVSAYQTQGRLTIEVENAGPTIAKKNKKKIFRSLVSLRNSQQSTGTNLGLGLYVVKLIAEFHRAAVKVENLEDQSGVVFSIIWAR